MGAVHAVNNIFLKFQYTKGSAIHVNLRLRDDKYCIYIGTKDATHNLEKDFWLTRHYVVVFLFTSSSYERL